MMEETRVNVEEIMRRIRREVSKRKECSDKVQGTSEGQGALPRNSGCSNAAGRASVSITEENLHAVDRFLWKYGLKYASLIKKIPVIRDVAERQFWRLSAGLQAPAGRGVDARKTHSSTGFLDTSSNYLPFLEELKKEGLRGRIKLFVFRFIGFFAWWQGQINRAVSEEMVAIRRQADIRAAVIKQKAEVLSREAGSLEKVIGELRRGMDELRLGAEGLREEISSGRAELGKLRREVGAGRSEVDALKDVMRANEKKMDELRLEIEDLKVRKDDLEEDHSLDAMYLQFEDRFRGTREQIKESVEVYLPYLRSLRQRLTEMPLLDLGCGRGEWLQVLREKGYSATGVDHNSAMVGLCKELGLNVVEADALTYLRQQTDGCWGAVTAFHLIEHLTFRYAVSLIDEALRVLRPGGMAIFETPNPENIIVGSCNFYSDPTHRNPIPPVTLDFLLSARGFVDTEIVRLHPYAYFPDRSDKSAGHNDVEDAFTMAQDYSVIAFKGI